MGLRWADWPILPRAALDDLAGILAGGVRGVALLGAEGVGKTTLAAQAVERLGAGRPLRVTGTAAQSAVPFGAFGALIDFRDIGRPDALIRSATEALLSQAGSAPIIVDNARLLDQLSASLVYRLASEGTGPLIVTVRTVLRIPQVVAALWNDGLLARFDVSGLDAAETAALAAAAGSAEAADLYRRSAGNPLHARLLLTTGGAEETLPAAVDRYLAGLDVPVLDVLGHLCVFEPLARGDLVALNGEAAVAAATAAGAVRGGDTAVYAGHPLFLERLAAGLDRDSVGRLRAAVARQLANRPARTPADRTARALLTLHSEGPFDAAETVACAQEALRLGDLGLAERLAGGVAERTDRLDARLALSYALAWQGRGREADAVLADVNTAGLTEEQLMAWALPRAANQFWMLSEPERATVFLQTVRRRVGTADARSTLDGLAATFAMNAGNVRRAVQIAAEVLDRPGAPDTAVAWAAAAAALSSARMGRLAGVAPLAGRALAAEHPGLLRFTVVLAEITVLLMSGQADAAEQTARRLTDLAEPAQPGRAIGEVLLAGVLIARGDNAAAIGLLAPASAALERTGYSWGPLALTLLTTALAHEGQIAESAKALGRAQSRHGTKSALFAPELGIARAGRLSTIGDRPGAVIAARDAARMAERAGQYAIAVRAWHEAALLGDRRAADGPDRRRGAVRVHRPGAGPRASGGRRRPGDGERRDRAACRGRVRRAGAGESAGEVTAQGGCHRADLGDRHPLVGAVGEVGVTRTIVDRGDAQRGKPGHVGPAVFGPHPPAGGRHQCGGRRVMQARQRPGGHIGLFDADTEAVEHLVHVGQRRLGSTVRREAEVDGDRGHVGYHVAGHTAADTDRREALPVGAAVDVDHPGPVGGQPFEHGGEFVDRVVPQPGSRGVRPRPGRGEHRSQGALAARLDVPAGGLAEDGDVPTQPARQLAFDAAESVGTRLDLFAVVEDQGDVVNRLGEAGGQVEEHRVAGLHVRGAAAVDVTGVAPRRQVSVGRDSVEVPGQDHPSRPAEVSPGQHRVAVADHLVPGLGAQRRLDLVGDPAFVPRLTGDVHQRRGQQHGVGLQIQHDSPG